MMGPMTADSLTKNRSYSLGKGGGGEGGRVVLTVADAHTNALGHDAHCSPEVCSPKKSVQNSGSILLHLGSQSNVTPAMLA
jgi:hypothetical protein